MIALFFALIPSLLWDQGPQTAPVLEKAGIRSIAVPNDAGAWAGTRIRAVAVDVSKLEKLDAPGVDYQLGRAGATAVPWINSNLWRMARNPRRTYLIDAPAAAATLAVAEACAGNVPVYIKVPEDGLAAFGAAVRFLQGLDAPRMAARANFALVDDASDEIEEVMNLLARRNLLFSVIRPGESWTGTTVRIGAREYPKEAAADPYQFAAMVRDRVGDARRLVRLYGSETTLARLYGDASRSRLHLIQYGRNGVSGLRVRVLGKYPRVMVAVPGQKIAMPEDLVIDDTGTEFTMPDFRNYAIVDLDGAPAGVLRSVYSESDFPLSVDPDAPQWRTAPKVVIDRNAAGEPLPIGPTEVRSRWTKDSVYLLFSSPYNQLHLHPNPVVDRDTPSLWDWDVAEAFVGGDFDNIGQYREYQVSPQGEWVDLDIDVVNPKPKGGIEWNSGYQVKARIDEARKIWYGEMKIPLASVAAKQFRAGDKLRLGLFRCTGLPPNRLFVSWQPAFRRSFHTPESFGTLVLQ